MGELQVAKASEQNYKQIVPFITKVFKVKFAKKMAKVYSHDEYIDSHYIAKDGTKIVCNTLSYPLKIVANDKELLGRGIGNVAVNPKYRGQKLMDRMLSQAVADAKEEGVHYMCLSGNRKRYERYGFAPCNTATKFTLTKENVVHTKVDKVITFERLDSNSPYLAEVERLYNGQTVRYERKYFYDVLTTWDNPKMFVAICDGKAVGHIVASLYQVVDFNAVGVSAKELILNYYKTNHKLPFLYILAYPHRRDMIESLASVCQGHELVPCAMMNIFDYKSCIDVLLNANPPKCDWTIVVEIENDSRLKIVAKSGKVSVENTQEAADVVLPKDIATVILCNSQLAMQYGLPFSLPLYVTMIDNV